MVEYITKTEVIEALQDECKRCVRQKDDGFAEVLRKVIRRVNGMESLRPPLPTTWKTLGTRKDAIYCGGCGFQTLAYKRTKFCPNCGRPMLNGVSR